MLIRPGPLAAPSVLRHGSRDIAVTCFAGSELAAVLSGSDCGNYRVLREYHALYALQFALFRWGQMI